MARGLPGSRNGERFPEREPGGRESLLFLISFTSHRASRFYVVFGVPFLSNFSTRVHEKMKLWIDKSFSLFRKKSKV